MLVLKATEAGLGVWMVLRPADDVSVKLGVSMACLDTDKLELVELPELDLLCLCCVKGVKGSGGPTVELLVLDGLESAGLFSRSSSLVSLTFMCMVTI